MSAPPIGMTAMMPSSIESPRRIQKYWPPITGSCTNMYPENTIPTRIALFTIRWPANTIAAEFMISDSLPYAIREPEVVTPPIRIDRMTVTSTKLDGSTPTAGASAPPMSEPISRPSSSYSAAQPTSSDAAPPEPLKSATISGMDVIATMRAAAAPISVPSSMATMMYS